MYELGPGILPNSICVPLTPTTHAQALYFYPTLCGQYSCDTHYIVNRQGHENPLLLFIRNGMLRLQYEGQIYHAGKGDIILLDCSRPHCYEAEENVDFLYLHFDGSNAHALVQDITMDSPLLRKEENVLVGERLYDLIQSYRRHGIENEIESSMRIYQLLMLLAMPPERMTRRDTPVNQTVDYIRAHVGESITLQSLADMAHLSACHYSHAFKQQTGFSPMEYVINTRLEKAKMLLLQTTMPIIDIAYEVGYESGSSLSSLFIKKVGCSPREYRRSNGIGVRENVIKE